MIGYYKDPEASAEKIRDGWLRTGDLFRQDSAGNSYIVGRMARMIMCIECFVPMFDVGFPFEVAVFRKFEGFLVISRTSL